MIVIGLTGSIGMGKSTTAAMFREAGIPVHDSDEAVHRLYHGAAVGPVEQAFPGVAVDGVIDREKLAKRVLGDAAALRRLEAIVHPLARADSERFLEENRAKGADIVLLDIPLLFETGSQDRVDRIVVVTAPADVQRERVLSRPGMTPEKFAAILARQTPDAEKRRQAHFLVDTSQGLEPARRQVEAIIAALRREIAGQKQD